MTDSNLQIVFGVEASGAVQGADQVKSAIGDIAPKIKELSNAFGDLGEKLKGGFQGFQSFAKSLQTASASGAEGLAGLAEAGEGVVGAAAAVGQVAMDAAGAMAEWAARTKDSSTASGEARQNAANLNTALGQAQKVFGDVGDTVANAFAPVMTIIVTDLKNMAMAFIDNYRHGGEAKTVIETLVLALKAVVTWIDGIVTWNAVLWDVWKGTWDGISAVVSAWFKTVGDGARNLGQTFVDLGRTIFDALTANISDGAGALRALMKDMGAAATQLNSDMAAQNKAFGQGANPSLGQAAGDIEKFGARTSATVFGAPHTPQPEGGSSPTRNGPLQPGTSSAPGATPASAAAGNGSSVAAQQQAQLYVATLQAAYQQDETNKSNQLANEQADELAYWTRQLATANLTAAERAAIQAKIDDLTRASHKQALDGQVADERAAAQQTLEARLKSISEETSATIKGAQEQLAAQKTQIQDQIAGIKGAYEAGQITRNQEWVQIEALHARETQAAIAAAQTEYQAAADAMARKAALGSQDIASVVQTTSDEVDLYMAYWSNVERLSAEGHRQLINDDRTALAELKKDWDATVNPIVSRFTTGLMQMAEGTKSFAQVMRGLGQQLLEDWLKNVDKMVEKWLWGQLAQLAASRAKTAQEVVLEAAGANQTMTIGGAAALKDITNSAAQAAGGAYKALSGVPIIGPVLGAAAAAAVFGGVMAFKGLISSAAGGFDIPAGLNPLTQLHAQEMVLPARLANPMRDMLSSFSSGQSSGAGQGGGEVHNHTHNWSVSAMDGPSVEKFLRTHGDRMVKVLNERARANAGVALGYAR